MALGLVAAVPTSASAVTRYAERAGPAAYPPVIVENFKPVLACGQRTTVGQEGCGEHHVLAADEQLNADVKVIFGLLGTKASRRDFVAAQAAWLAYRNADCKSRSDAYEGGTEQPVAYVYCLAADDGARHQELKTFFDVLAQGRADVPNFP